MAKVRDLTKGNIGKKLILFAIPMLLSSLVQQLYNTVDLIYAGNFLGKSASASIGASSLLITCLVGFFGGMSVGSGVVVSQIYGAGEQEKLKKAVHNAVALCLAGGLLFMLLGMGFAPVYLRLVHTPVELQASAVLYLRIYMLSFPALFVYNIGSGVLRALGDSRSPLAAQFAGGLVNVGMDYLFIRVFHDGVCGVAWATLFSQSVAAAITLYNLSRLPDPYRLHGREIRFEASIVKEVIRIGVPAGCQSLVITLSNVIAQYFINSFGEDSIAAFTAYFKVELIIYLPIVAFGQAIMAFSGQCKGAEDYSRIRKGTGLQSFHGCLWEILRNPLMKQIWEATVPPSNAITALPLIVPVRQESYKAEMRKQHGNILKAVKDHDPEYAFFYMLQHCDWIYETYQHYFEEFCR